MRRIELVKAVEEVLQTINESRLQESIETTMEAYNKDKPGSMFVRLFDALKKYSIGAHSFSPAAKSIANIFGLDEIERTDLWAQIHEPDGRGIMGHMHRTLVFATDYLPKLIPLFQQESLQSLAQPSKDSNLDSKGKGVLSVIVFEQDDRLSSPTRLANVLDSITLFYETCALMNDYSAQELSVLACDSGSDKSFDFLGAAKVIECVKELILSLWDRVVFYREHQFGERLELIASSLPIIAQINALERENVLEREQAEIYRRNIFEGSNKFIESGATIPEVEHMHHDVRRLMSPAQKLLTSGPREDSLAEDEDRDKVKNDLPQLDNLTDKEREDLLRLLDKTRQKVEDSPDTNE